MACIFSTSQLPKVVKQWCVLYIFTWKCASRHNSVHFFISRLASSLRARRFSEPTFSTLRSHKSLEKHSVSRLSSLFAHLRLLSSDSFSSTVLSLLSASSLLCFASVHIVGSLTSKLPSTKGADNCPAVQRHKRKYRKGGMRRKSVNAKAGRQTVAWIQTPV